MIYTWEISDIFERSNIDYNLRRHHERI